MTWWHYLLLSNLYLILFFGFYALLLRRETFFQLNRIYLVGSALLSFGIPLIQSDWVKQWFITEQVRQTIYQANPQFIYVISVQKQPVTLGEVMFGVYIAGIVVLTVKFLWQLLALKRFIVNGQEAAAWSFFKKIKVDDELAQHDVIMAHEQVHARQWHSADVLLIEALMIVNWFNPVVYLYRNAIKHIHEFIADRDALKAGASKAEYAMLLLSQTFNAPVHGLLNPFFNQSILKQRILMLQKSRSTYMALIKYGFSAPLFALMLILSSATISNSSVVKDIHQTAQKVLELPAQAAFLPDTVQVTPSSPSIVQRTWPSALKEGHLLASKNTALNELQKAVAPEVIKITEPDSAVKQQGELFTSVEQTPEFPGGMESFYRFVAQRVHYPKAARDNNIQGRTIITFVVEKDGSLSDVKSLRDPGYGLGEEAVRAVAESPKWIPGQQNGKQVRVQYTVPVAFTLADVDKPRADTLKKVQFITLKRVSFKKDNLQLPEPENAEAGSRNVVFKTSRAEPPPLIMIDGKEAAAGTDLRNITPDNIKSINVLKGNQALAVYGSKAEKGVIIITTLQNKN